MASAKEQYAQYLYQEYLKRNQQASSNAEPSASNVNQDESADVGFWNRFIAKNFAGDTRAAAAYIKQQKPDLDVSVFGNEVVVKKKGETNWKPLDSSSLEFQDITDIAYDIPAGIAQGLATTAAAIPAGLATGGVAALPAGMAASAASGAGLEAARMGVGSALGIPDNFKGGNVGWAAGLGAAAPLAFGVGKLPQSIQQSGRGLIKRGIDKVGPSLMELATGIPSDIQQAFKQYQPEIKALSESNQPNSIIYDVTEKIQKGLGNRRTELGKKVGEAIDTASGPINIAGAKSPFMERLNFLKSKPYITNAEQAEINSLQSYYNKYFGLAEPYSAFKQTATNAPESRAVILFNQSSELGPQLDSSINMSKQTYTELPNEINAQRAFDLQQKLNRAAAWETNMTPETASAKGSARQAYFDINKNLDEATSGLSQEAKNNYANYKALERDLANKFNTPQQTYNTFIGLDKNNKKIALDRLKQLAGENVLDVSPEVNQIRALNAFYDLAVDPYFTPTSKPKNTGLQAAAAALGSLAGYGTGGGYAGAAVGGIGAQQAAKLAGTKQAARAYMNLGSAIDKAALSPWLQNQYLNPARPALNPWLYQTEEQP